MAIFIDREGQRIGGSKRGKERRSSFENKRNEPRKIHLFRVDEWKSLKFQRRASQPASHPARLPTGNTERVEVSTKKGVGESFVPSSGRVDAPVKSIGRPEVETKAADFHADSTTDLHAFLSLIPLLMSLSRKLSSRPSR